MKKLALCVTGALLAVSLAACSPTQKETSPAGGINVEQSTGGASDKVPDPTAEVLEMASIYVPDENKTGLRQMMDGIAATDAEALVEKLVEYGVLPEGCEVLSFETTGESENNSGGPGEAASVTTAESAVLDLSVIPDGDSIDNQLVAAAIGNTFTENLNIRSLTIQENGTTFAENVRFQSDFETLITE